MPTKSKRSPIRIIISIVILLVAGYYGIDLTKSGGSAPNGSSAGGSPDPSQSSRSEQSQASNTSTPTVSIAPTQRAIVGLAESQRSGQMVELNARVVKLLDDDNDGARHQRFLIAIDYTPSPIQTVLVAHNIDLAPRVPLREGSVIRIYGQYEWNDRGGVLHWTHHDPGGRHAEGWIELDGTVYD